MICEGGAATRFIMDPLRKLIPLLLLLGVTAASAAVSAPKFPARFTSDVNSESSQGNNYGCGGLPIVQKVYQDDKSSLWLRSLAAPDGIQVNFHGILFTIPGSTADPDTPEATQLTRFTWNSEKEHTPATAENCEYRIYTYSNGVRRPEFFDFKLSKLEKKEVVGNIECEKWSGLSSNSTAWPQYRWAVWFPINVHPPYSVVVKAEYTVPDTPPHMFPVPGCTMTYTFANFSTDPIPQEVFAPPKQWLTKCNDSDGGIQQENIPGRQEGYVCVSPGKNNQFSIALLTKPQHDVTVRIEPCSSGDGCIDGARCKDCVKLSKPVLTFGPSNWSVLQTVEVTYLADGDTQYKITSPNYYISNGFNVQFSTCACASGKCSNNCQNYCGRG